MNFLNNIIQNSLPPQWENVDYGTKSHVRVNLSENSPEYVRVKEEFIARYPHLTIKAIDRIQHPSAYGLFTIRKEYLEKLSKTAITTKTLFWSVLEKNDIDTILTYNCDLRRGNFKKSFNATNKIEFVLVIKSVKDCSEERDCNYYVEYIINLNSSVKALLGPDT